MKKVVPYLVLFSLIFSCRSEQNSQNSSQETNNIPTKISSPLFQQIDEKSSGLDFVNEVIDNDILNYFTYFHLYMGAGMATGDLNNDGLPDLFFNSNLKENKLYLNEGNLKFADQTIFCKITDNQGFTTGVTMVDVNRDGWLDIYICKTGNATMPKNNANRLYINNGNAPENNQIPTFTERGAEYGLASANNSIQASFFDYDKDGDLDMYLINTPEDFSLTAQISQMDYIHNNQELRQHQGYDQLFKNENGKFVDVTSQAGILSDIGFGLGVLTVDVNQDGWTDIFVGNDFMTPDYLYINQKNGKFKERSKDFFQHTSFYSMGMDIADLNHDGMQDIFVLDMLPEDYKRSKTAMEMVQPSTFEQAVKWGYNHQYMHNNLHLNNGFDSFSEVAQMAGVHKSDWSWSALFGDFDLDGNKDLYITNGIQKDVTERDFKGKIKKRQQEKGSKLSFNQIKDLIPSEKLANFLYHNQGDLTFKNVAAEWGLDQPSFSNGSVAVDLDADGDLDLVTNNVNSPAFLYENLANDLNTNYLNIKLKGSKSVNSLNSTVTLKDKNGKILQSWEMLTTRGYMSCGEEIAYFGLGKLVTVPLVEIGWADGKTSQLTNVKSNQLLEIAYETSNPANAKENIVNPLLKKQTSTLLSPPFVHKENPFDDYQNQRLLPHRQSKNGPSVSVADVDGDGLEDFLVGGAHQQTAVLYLQNSDGKFSIKNTPDFVADQNFEDLGSLFFDADGDGDKDLYVVSGGTEFKEKTAYQDRMYFNDGKGNFKKDMRMMIAIESSGSCVKAADYDKDGDLDLFVGGRVLPDQYPYPAQSYLLKNENGRFVNITNSIAPELSKIGMVTSAIWSDFNSDGNLDLIVVGEWMNIELFENQGKSFTKVTQKYGLEETRGWWNRIVEVDLDNDGDLDYVVGNLGLNYKFHASKEKPLKIYCDDFDKNGSYDVILAKNINEEDFPVRGRSCSSEQMPFIKDKFPTFGEFADADLSDIYGEQNLNAALSYQAQLFESVILRNNNGAFSIEKLPRTAQVSPINGIVSADFNQDGKIDLLVAGNHYGAEVETTRADAGIGLLLTGNGRDFFPTVVKESGFFADKDVKDLVKIQLANGLVGIIVVNNNEALEIFAF
ncbi:MAG: hypothetical protein ACI9XO_003220 [Paraglaciecola sp.]|jgi:hypothetical protein